MSDRKLLYVAVAMLLLPLSLAFFGGDRFRYPCQDPDNWDKDFCKMPKCDVTRTCPEHVFKGGRDPRLGMPDDQKPTGANPALVSQGANCGK